MYYLLLSGFIPEQKQSEFDQTCMLVTSQIPQTCIGYNIHKDKADQLKYRFISYWPDYESAAQYMNSPGYIMLLGAFSTLGELIEKVHGEMDQSLKKNLFSRESENQMLSPENFSARLYN